MHVCSLFSFIAHAKACALLLCLCIGGTTAWAIHPEPYDPDPLDFAVEVISYDSGTGVGSDWITGESFTNALNALGRPTVDTTAHGSGVDPDWILPVVPVWPAYRATELVTIGQGGHLILRFGRPVFDHPHNPFGRDFIIFGNALQTTAPTSGLWIEDPASASLIGNVFEEPGIVSVSQDGTNWFTFTNGPFADTFAPTLGRIYDPDDPAEIGDWNEWWSAPTNPTWPLDPALVATNLAGRSLVEVAQIYGHSAGGTSFDLGELDLPIDPATGWKWIRYIKIEPQEGAGITPEIDAVAIVSPASDYQRWHLEQFSWEERLDSAIGGDLGFGTGHGMPNVLAYALGRDRIQEGDPSPPAMNLLHASDEHALRIQFTRRTNDSPVQVVLESTHDLGDAEGWSTNNVIGEITAWPHEPGTETVELKVPLHESSDFDAYRLRGVRR